MERVAFLVEATNQRLGCLLNPEDLVVRRQAGVRRRRSGGGALSGASLADDPLLFTGGGRTELLVNLLFDVSLEQSTSEVEDVRELTSPLWELTENAVAEEAYGRPPMVRFVWGKSWNIPGVVTAVAERLEQFSLGGIPRRSWLSLSFVRCLDEDDSAGFARARRPQDITVPHPAQGFPELGAEQLARTAAAERGEVQTHSCVAGERLDQIVVRYYGQYGDPSLWRLLAAYNGVQDPLRLVSGSTLQIPSLSVLEGRE